MSQNIINTGQAANDGTGEPLRQAFTAINNNFSQIWSSGPVNSNVQITDNKIVTLQTNQNLVLAPNGIGDVQANTSIVPDLDHLRDLGSVDSKWDTVWAYYIDAESANIGSFGNLSIDVANLHISGGSNGYVLQTDGIGNLTWTAQTGGTGNGTPGGANTQIQFNNAGSFDGSPYLTWDSGNAQLNTVKIAASNAVVYGTVGTIDVQASGNVLAQNILSDNFLYANGQPFVSPAAGNTTQVQFNNNGALAGHPNFTFDQNTDTLQVPANLIVDNIYSVDSSTVHVHDNLETFGDMTAVGYYLTDGGSWISVDANTTAFTAHANLQLVVDNGNTWIFDENGNLTLPSNVASINYANGQPYGGSTYGDSNVTSLLNSFGSNSISTTGNVTSGYFVGDGSQLTNLPVQPGTYGDSNVTLLLGSFGSNSISTTGNVTVNYVIGDGSQLTNLPVQPGTYTDSNVTTLLSSFGSNTISTTGNVTASFVIGDGSQLTNLPVQPGTYTDANVTSLMSAFGSNSISTTGNVTSGYFVGDGSQLTNLPVQPGTYGNANVTSLLESGTVTTDINIQGNIVSGGDMHPYGNLTVSGNSEFYGLQTTVYHDLSVSENVSVTGNITGGNIITTGVVYSSYVTSDTGALTLQAASGYDLVLDPVAANISAASNWINNLADPVQAQDAATKKYVDDNSAGLNIHDPVLLASTTDLATYTGATVTYNNGTSGVGATLSLSGNTLTTLDGTAITGGSSTRLLIKNEANAVTNGVYNYTSNTLLTRATAEDQPAELGGGDYFFVQAGATQASSSWVQQGAVGNVGVDNINFVQFSASQTYSAGNALALNGSQFNVKVDNTTVAINGSNQLELAPNLTINTTSNITGGNLLTSGVMSSSGNSYQSNAIVNGYVTATGNVIGSYFIGNGSQLTGFANVAFTGNYSDLTNTPTIPTATSNLTNDSGFITSATANVISVNGKTGVVTVTEYSNAAVAAYLASGTDSSNIITTGNISGTYILGNAAFMTGIPAGYSDSNVTTLLSSFGSNTISSTGNITTTANISGGNLKTSGTISATGTITGSSLLGTVVSASGNVTGGNILTGGLISATGTITTASNLAVNGGVISTTAATANVFNVTPTTVNIASGASIATNIGNASGIVSLSGNVQGNTNGFAIGYRDIPQVTFSSNATIVLSDAGKHYYSTSASNLVMTIANSATANFAVGSAINLINQGTGTITVAQGSGVTLYYAGNSTSSNRTVASYGVATIQKVATDTWFIVGVGIT